MWAKIGFRTFAFCSSLTSIIIPNSVTRIEEQAFDGCSGLTGITIGASVAEIGDYAFSGCSGLTSITIPNSVTSIGSGVFSGCSGLTEITVLYPEPPSIEYIINNLGLNISAITLRVPSGSVYAYQTASGWSGFGNIIAI